MTLDLPVRGQKAWDTKLDAALNLLDDRITAALASVESATIGKPVKYLNVYDNFFGGYGWIPGQLAAETTTTAPVNAGINVLPLTSVAGISANVLLAAGGHVYRVTAVAGNNVTVTPAVVSALNNGAAVGPLFANVNHLYDTLGWAAFAKWVMDSVASDGLATFSSPISGPIVWLGDSWGAQGGVQFQIAVANKFPGAVTTVLGHPGETAQQLLARFNAEVPANASYVFFNEGPGVNDVIGGVTPAQVAATTELFVAACRNIGAIPAITGMIPMQNYPARSTEQQRVSKAQYTFPKFYPYISGSGVDQRSAPSRQVNDASFGVGVNALANNTSGDSNVGIGFSALFANTTGGSNVAVGTSALQSVVAGSSIVAIGVYAGFAPGGDGTKATVGGSSHVFIGYQSGSTVATDSIGNVAIGSGARAGRGNGAGAIGYGTTADDHGAWAIGTDSTATGASSVTQDEMALGTALHTVRIAGRLRLDRGQTTVGAAGGASALPATPTKYLSVKDSAGTEYVFPVYAKI